MPDEPNATERVYATLRADIISGVRPGNRRLTEDDLAAEFGVSREPVREALHALIVEGLVDRLPRHGGRVHALTRSDIADISELHAAFDVFAMRLAAVRRTEADLALFREDVARARKATEAGDIPALRKAGTDFRLHTFAATGNRALLDVYRALHGRTARMFELADRHLTTPAPFYDRFLVAFEQGSADDAARAMEELGLHIARARQARVLQELVDGSAAFSISEESALQPPLGTYTPESVAVRNQLREEIVSGSRAPGSVVSERSVAEAYDVSRGPARRAIEDLAFEGLIDLGASRRSSTVRIADEAELGDLFDTACVLDVLAARLAARCPSPEQIAELYQRLVAAQAVPAENVDELVKRTFDFRRQIYAMSGNRLILEVNRMFESRMRMMVSNAPLAKTVLLGHRLLFEAISSRDTDLAEAVYRSVFQRADRRGEILANAPSED